VLISFGGVSTESRNRRVEDHFELCRDDDFYAVYLSKKKFKHEEEDMNFEYKYGILVTDLSDYLEEHEGGLTIAVELLLVVSPYSMTEEEKEYLMGFTGVDMYTTEESMYEDLILHGYGIRFGIEYVKDEKQVELSKIPGVIEVVQAITEVYEGIDLVRGFYLDKPWNKVGTNGWDVIKNIVYGEPLFR